MSAVRPLVAALATVLVAALLAVGSRSALSAPVLPAMAADELIASVLRVAQDPPPMAGELSATLGLGLPQLPGEGPGGVLADLSGQNRLRVERSTDGVRAALLGEHSERVVISDGESLTTWDSRTMEVTRWMRPDGATGPDGLGGPTDGAPSVITDPLALAIPLVAMLEEDAQVTVDGSARVAGRDAYRLAIAPDDRLTTIGRVELDVDAGTSAPLRVAVFARGARAPTIEVAWTRVSFHPVDPAVFEFSAPPGATVTERSSPARLHGPGKPGATGPAAIGAGLHQGRTVGTGYSAVAVLPIPRGDLGQAAALLPLDGPLLSARLGEVDGDRVLLVGFVPLSRLDEVAAELR